MEQSGEYQIAANPDVVWAGLNDPEVLSLCIPGCIAIDRTGDASFQAKVKAKIGPVSATFDADLALTDLNPPLSYTITGGVKGGAAGFGKGEARVELTPVNDGTQLNYTVQASVGGKLAQIGSRLVDGAARKMADDFFKAFRNHLSPPQEEVTMDVETKSASETQANTTVQTEGKEEYEQDGNQLIWIVAFVVLGLAMLLAI